MAKITLLICPLVALALVSCQKSIEPMQILTEEYPPISFAIGDSISGYATDVVRALQEKIGSKDQIVLGNWTQLYSKALREKNVVLFSMEQTPQRKDLFNWIGPLGEHTSSFYVRADSPITLPNPESAKELKSIATTSDWFTEQFLKEQGFQNLVSSAQPTDNVDQVMKGTADATILSDLTAASIIIESGYEPDQLKPIMEVMKSKYYITISKKTSPRVVSRWEKAYREIVADGTLDKIRSAWIK